MVRIVAALLLPLLLVIAAHAITRSEEIIIFSRQSSASGSSGGGGRTCTDGTTAAAFNARASGQDNAHQDANCNLLNALDTNSITAKLDFLYMLATDTGANASLNMVGSGFTAVCHPNSCTAGTSPAFAANAGFTGVDASTTVFIDTTLSPTTGTPQFTTNGNHLSVWSNTAGLSSASGDAAIGVRNAGGSSEWEINVRYSDGNSYYRDGDGNNVGQANASGTGYYLVDRTASNAYTEYKNAASVGTSNNAAGAVIADTIYILAVNQNFAANNGSGRQIMAASGGGALTSGDVTNLCHAINVYLNAIAGTTMVGGSC